MFDEYGDYQGVAIDVILMDRDYMIMREINRWRFCLGRHIMELTGFTGQRACDRRLKILIDSGYINRKKVLYGIPSVYYLTHKGKMLLGLNVRQEKFRVERVNHDITVTDTAIYFHKQQKINFDCIITEKQLYSKDGFSKRKHYPDFEFVEDEKHYCVEVELSLKAKDRFEKVVKQNYLDYETQYCVVPKSELKINELLNSYSIKYPNIKIIFLEDVITWVRNNKWYYTHYTT